jgi:hypothetical protein
MPDLDSPRTSPLEATIKQLTEDVSNYIENPTSDNPLEMLSSRESLLLMAMCSHFATSD